MIVAQLPDLATALPPRRGITRRGREYRRVEMTSRIVGEGSGERDRSEIDALDRRWAKMMARAQDGDQNAYAQLLKDILPILRAVARRQHGNFDRAEDVVQDILLTIHRVRHTYDHRRSFRRWVFTIARRRSIDALRKRLRVAGYEHRVEQETIERVPGSAQEGGALEMESELAHALAGLSPGQREAIELVKLRELSLVEAAARSGVSVAAMKVAIHRAMKNLRQRLVRGLP